MWFARPPRIVTNPARVVCGREPADKRELAKTVRHGSGERVRRVEVWLAFGAYTPIGAAGCRTIYMESGLKICFNIPGGDVL